jgi:hypothetical protein
MLWKLDLEGTISCFRLIYRLTSTATVGVKTNRIASLSHKQKTKVKYVQLTFRSKCLFRKIRQLQPQSSFTTVQPALRARSSHHTLDQLAHYVDIFFLLDVVLVCGPLMW